MLAAAFVIPLICICANAAEPEITDSNVSAPLEEPLWMESEMDSFQEYWSKKILIFSSNLDRMFASGFDDDNVSGMEKPPEENASVVDDECRFSQPKFTQEQDKQTYQTSTWFDDFFKDETYLDATNKSYIKIRAGYEYDWRGEPSVLQNIKARIKLPRTQEKIQLFIGDDSDEKISSTDPTRTSGSEGIGIKYFLPSLYGRLFSNASIGFSGIDNPYARTHMEYPVFLQNWLFKAAQNFKYSVESKFDEWTDFTFDRPLSDKEMIRLLLQRSTNSEVIGMEYLLQLSYRVASHHDIGTSYYVGFNGRTKDLTGSLYNSGLTPQEGVYQYAAGIVWRQQLYKEYLVYQIEPILSLHEQYNFKPNYLLRLTLELYFGYKR